MSVATDDCQLCSRSVVPGNASCCFYDDAVARASWFMGILRWHKRRSGLDQRNELQDHTLFARPKAHISMLLEAS